MARWKRLSNVLAGGSAVLAALLCAGGLALRLGLAAHDIESPHKDENEVVEQAVAFLGGDLRFHFLKYGPLLMYVLAGVYRATAALHGVSTLDYASRVFFDGQEHYFIARAVCAVCLCAFALLAFALLRRQIGAGPALLASALSGLPCVDVLFTGSRVDVPQAVFQGAALAFLGQVVTRPQLGHWLLAGACAGFAVASKPLPGLLVLPSFVLASWFCEPRVAGGAGGTKALARRAAATLVRPGLLVAVAACVASALLGNPAMLDYERFFESQRSAIALHSSSQVAWSHQSALGALGGLGAPFLTAAGLAAAVACLSRERRALLVVQFLVLYLAAFWGRAARPYYMVAPALAACLLIGYAFRVVLQRELRWRGLGAGAGLALAIVVVALPAQALYRRTRGPGSITLARRWVHEHVPSGTRLVHVGWWPNGPRIVADRYEVQAKWGDYFDYGRNRYPFLRRALRKGYDAYLASGQPRYSVAVHDERPETRKSKRTRRSITDRLLENARAKRQRYIILAGFRGADVYRLGYPWFRAAILEQRFGSIAIFQVPPADAPSQNASVSSSEM